jgi:nitroreductase
MGEEFPHNPVLETIRLRRSVRRYQRQEVPRQLLERILEAANQAPSAHNKQAWKFVVIGGVARERLAEAISAQSVRFPRTLRVLLRLASQIVLSAPEVIAIFTTGELLREGGEGGDQAADFFRLMEIQSSAAAVQNLMLAASSLGLGTVWLGAVCLIRDEIQNLLGQEGDLMALVPVGYPAGPPGGSPRKKDYREVTVF